MPRFTRDEGFTLLEVTIATSLLVVVALGSAQLFVLAVGHNVTARQQLLLTLAAARKADELCAAAAAGPPRPSPHDALERDVEGFSDVSVEAGMSCARRWLLKAPTGYPAGLLAVVVRARGADGHAVQMATVCEAPRP
jgi:prepilin-type N-terminal cleavage/methylation domain-containing protein